MIGPARLFDTTRTERWRGSKALVPVGDDCPTCSGALDRERVTTEPLLRHGGYGAALTSVRDHCPACGWSLLREVSEERPLDRRTA